MINMIISFWGWVRGKFALITQWRS